jgi:putative restriction endonuclease
LAITSNGILLRSDLHKLFDLGLLTVEATSMTVKLASSLKATTYAVLDGKPIQLPHDNRLCPSRDALAKSNSFSSGQMKNWIAS